VEASTVSADRRRLFLASFLMLFVELVLIRWLRRISEKVGRCISPCNADPPWNGESAIQLVGESDGA
jgi:hypothetical protein